MQLIGHIFRPCCQRKGERGAHRWATSGDTGSAASRRFRLATSMCLSSSPMAGVDVQASPDDARHPKARSRMSEGRWRWTGFRRFVSVASEGMFTITPSATGCNGRGNSITGAAVLGADSLLL